MLKTCCTEYHSHRSTQLVHAGTPAGTVNVHLYRRARGSREFEYVRAASGICAYVYVYVYVRRGAGVVYMDGVELDVGDLLHRVPLPPKHAVGARWHSGRHRESPSECKEKGSEK